MMKKITKLILFALIASTTAMISYGAAEKAGAPYLVKPKHKTIQSAHSINDLKETAQNVLIEPYFKQINETDVSLLGAIEAQAWKQMNANEATKQNFINKYIELMDSDNTYSFQNPNRKKLAAQAEKEWDEIKTSVISEINAQCKQKFKESECCTVQ